MYVSLPFGFFPILEQVGTHKISWSYKVPLDAVGWLEWSGGLKVELLQIYTDKEL